MKGHGRHEARGIRPSHIAPLDSVRLVIRRSCWRLKNQTRRREERECARNRTVDVVLNVMTSPYRSLRLLSMRGTGRPHARLCFYGAIFIIQTSLFCAWTETPDLRSHHLIDASVAIVATASFPFPLRRRCEWRTHNCIEGGYTIPEPCTL